MSSALRIGVVGAGNIAHVAQFPALARRDDVVLVGVVTRTAESAAAAIRRWPVARAFNDVEDMLAVGVDALVVLTPRQIHTQNVRTALEGGVDVFCEKPLASTVAEAEELAGLAERSGRILMVGFNRRFAPCYRRVKELFGKDGPQIIAAQKNRPGTEYRATFENAIHMIDLMRYLCGEPESVSAHSIVGTDPHHEKGVSALVKFKSGAIGTLVAARVAGVWDERLDAYGQHRSAFVTAPNGVAIAENGVTSKFDEVSGNYGWASVTDAFGFAASIDEFLGSVVSRAVPESDGWSAARTQRLLDDILEHAGLPTEDAPDMAWRSHAQQA